MKLAGVDVQDDRVDALDEILCSDFYRVDSEPMTVRESVIIEEMYNRTDNSIRSVLPDPVDRRLAKLIGRSMQVPGRHGFQVLFREFMQRGYEEARHLPKGNR